MPVSPMILVALSLALSSAAAVSPPPGEFRLTVGNTIAGNTFKAKADAFVVRPDGCAEPGKVRITGTADGIVNGVRRTLPLKLTPLPTPGVHGVPRDWPAEGVWVVSLAASCRDKTAGVIVPFGPKTFLRESIKSLPRAATPGEIEASLKQLATNGGTR
jgi:hypothetical protein